MYSVLGADFNMRGMLGVLDRLLARSYSPAFPQGRIGAARAGLLIGLLIPLTFSSETHSITPFETLDYACNSPDKSAAVQGICSH
jgi:hypothetical protein